MGFLRNVMRYLGSKISSFRNLFHTCCFHFNIFPRNRSSESSILKPPPPPISSSSTVNEDQLQPQEEISYSTSSVYQTIPDREIIITEEEEEEETGDDDSLPLPLPRPLPLPLPLEERNTHTTTIGIRLKSTVAKGGEEEQGGKDNINVVVTKNVVDVVLINDFKRIKHYNNQHKILLVGEGDFSFSACLALAFGRAPNIIATSLNSKEFLEKNYEKAASNIEKLRMRDCKVMHGIDATKIAKHASIGHIKFDRIIFNFPFAGFFTKLSDESVLRRHRRLVSLFLKNAKEMLSEDGEIHISHKTNGSHSEWNVESMASSHGLRLIQAVKFRQRDYPGYNTKYGFGGDKNFNCNPSKTYKFGLKIN